MKVNPQPIVQRENLNLRLGIKCSMPEIAKLFAATFSIYAATNKGEVYYSEQYSKSDNKIGIRITSEIRDALIDFFGQQTSRANITIEGFLNSFNNTPLFTQHLEALQVALELFWKMGVIKFSDESFPNTAERTGGNRFSKELYFSTNLDLIYSAFSDLNNILYTEFKDWLFDTIIGKSPTNSVVENKLAKILTIFSEETAYKIRINGSETVFQTIGIYNEIEQGNSVVSNDSNELVGPMRILKSATGANLNYYITDSRENGFMLNERASLSELSEYSKRVNTMLSLSPKNTSIEIIEQVFEISLPQNNNNKMKNIIYYGAPGTGKSHRVEQRIKDLDKHFYERVTFHPEFDNASFIGGYKPKAIEEGEKKGEITYEFVPQAFAKIYARAWKEQDDKNYYLVIEEINRGNCAEIFGEIFQLLDRDSNYDVTPSEEFRKYLVEEFGDENHEGIKRGLKLPPNLHIWATMNTSDQSLFPMDSAFKRRWQWEYCPICYNSITEDDKINESFKYEIDIQDGNKYKWIEFIKKINLDHIKPEQNLGADKCIGNYFIKPDEGNTITLKPFINKVIFYLWNDVFKDEHNKVFEDNTSYEDFFPINTAGKQKVKELFTRIGLQPIPESDATIADTTVEEQTDNTPE